MYKFPVEGEGKLVGLAPKVYRPTNALQTAWTDSLDHHCTRKVTVQLLHWDLELRETPGLTRFAENCGLCS